MSGTAINRDRTCRSLGFVNNPPRLYGRTMKVCYPTRTGGGGGGGVTDVNGMNIGVKDSPDTYVGEVFASADVQPDDSIKFLFRRLVSVGDDTIVAQSPNSLPTSVLRGTDTNADVVCFRNLNNADVPIASNVDCVPILAGVSEDDTTVIFNQVCLGDGLTFSESSPAGQPVIEFQYGNVASSPPPNVDCFDIIAGISDDGTVVFNQVCVGDGLQIIMYSPEDQPVIELDLKLQDCNQQLMSPVTNAVSLVPGPGGVQTVQDTNACFQIASLLPSNTVLITNVGNDICPIYEFNLNLLEFSPGIDTVLAGCDNIPIVLPSPATVDGLVMGDAQPFDCTGTGDVCAGLDLATGKLKFRRLISQGSADESYDENASPPLLTVGPFSVLRDTVDIVESPASNPPTEGYVRFRNLDNLPVPVESPQPCAIPILAGMTPDCSTILFRQIVAGPDTILNCDEDGNISIRSRRIYALVLSSGSQSVGNNVSYIGQGSVASGIEDNAFRGVCITVGNNGMLRKMVVLVKKEDIIDPDDMLVATVYIRSFDSSPDFGRRTTALTCTVPPGSPQTSDGVRCCVVRANVPVLECDCVAIRIENMGITNVNISTTLTFEEDNTGNLI